MGSTQSKESNADPRSNALEIYRENSAKEKSRKRIERLLQKFVPDIQTTTPQQLSKFLFSMEESGRTQYHVCPHAGTASPGRRIISICKPNECPDSIRCPHIPHSRIKNTCIISSSPDSVKNTVSHLRTTFRRLGKQTRWQNGLSYTENPAISDIIDDHIKLKEQEATDALIQPLQATPIFKSDVDKILDRLRTLSNDAKNLREKVAWSQQTALISLLQASGRRPGDIIRLNLNLGVIHANQSGHLLRNEHTQNENDVRDLTVRNYETEIEAKLPSRGH
ncbi:hypothetical protein BDR26DRAFT_958091 [Obelidium mucronatum]|nr:hypothetical protein BDR26DRAFT_958091 [Obelidium mucronatum]